MPRHLPTLEVLVEARLRAERRTVLPERTLEKWERVRDGAEPVELLVELEPEQVDEHRNLWCPRYDLCVDFAGVMDWRSFSCATCRHRTEGERPKVDEVDGLDDGVG